MYIGLDEGPSTFKENPSLAPGKYRAHAVPFVGKEPQKWTPIWFTKLLRCLCLFCCTTVIDSKAVIRSKKYQHCAIAYINIIDAQNTAPVFKLYFNDDLSNIDVFLCANWEGFNWDYDVPKFFLPEKYEPGQARDHYSDSSITSVGEVILKAGKAPPEYISYFQSHAGKQKGQKLQLLTYLGFLPGYKAMELSNDSTEGAYRVGQQYLKGFVWVAPWAREVIRDCRSYIIDASFKGTKPYVYSVFMGEDANASYPFALSVGITENEALYQNAYNVMKDNGIEMLRKPVISDLGSSIMAFCQSHNFEQFWCQRHFLNLFGTNSFACKVMKRVTKALTEKDFTQELMQARCDLDEYVKKHGTDENIQKAYQCINFDPGKNDEKYNPAHWAMYHRYSGGFPTTSNALESFHGHVNRSKARRSSVKNGTFVIISHIFEHMRKISKNAQAVVNNRISKIRRHPVGSRNICECHKSKYLSALFRIENFPCCHTVSNLGTPHNVKIRDPIQIPQTDFPNRGYAYTTAGFPPFDLRNLTERQRQQKRARLEKERNALLTRSSQGQLNPHASYEIEQQSSYFERSMLRLASDISYSNPRLSYTHISHTMLVRIGRDIHNVIMEDEETITRIIAEHYSEVNDTTQRLLTARYRVMFENSFK